MTVLTVGRAPWNAGVTRCCAGGAAWPAVAGRPRVSTRSSTLSRCRSLECWVIARATPSSSPGKCERGSSREPGRTSDWCSCRGRRDRLGSGAICFTSHAISAPCGASYWRRRSSRSWTFVDERHGGASTSDCRLPWTSQAFRYFWTLMRAESFEPGKPKRRRDLWPGANRHARPPGRPLPGPCPG